MPSELRIAPVAPRTDRAALRVVGPTGSRAALPAERLSTRAVIERLEKLGQQHLTLRRGQRVLEPRAPCRALYLVRYGSLKSSLTALDGREQIVGFHLPGDLVGLAALGCGVHRCGVQALEPTSLCTVPAERIERLAREAPAFARALYELLAEDAADVPPLLLLLGKGSAGERLAAFLLGLSRHRAARGLSPATLDIPMSRHEIGDYLGLALETVSRQLTRLQVAGVLRVERRLIEILDLEGLGREAGELPAPRAGAHPARSRSL